MRLLNRNILKSISQFPTFSTCCSVLKNRTPNLLQIPPSNVPNRFMQNRTKMELAGKNVLYVGGFGGIGFATCKRLVTQRVANLFILDLKLNDDFFCELKEMGGECTNVYFDKLDLTKKEQIAPALKNVVSKMDFFDILVNGSGIINDRKIQQTIDIVFSGLVYTTMEAIPYMDKGNGGKGGMIVNIVSVVGLEPCPPVAIYTGAKHGAMGFTRSIADEFYYKKTGIAVMAICPGITTTGLWNEFEGNDTFKYSDELSKRLISAKNQDAEQCSCNFIKAMETGKNGSIWILDLGNLEEVKPKVYWKPTFDKD